MKLSSVLLACLVFLLGACAPGHVSYYKRFPLPEGTDEPTAGRVIQGVFQAMRSQPFVDELKKRFPAVTQEQLLKTDMQYQWVEHKGVRTYYVSFGVKDLSGFPDAESFVDFAIEYGKTEAERLLPPTEAKKG